MSATRRLRPVSASLLVLLWIAFGALPVEAVEEGLASWYGGKFQGRKTASGEVFDTNLLTAAHKTLPFGTLVRVTNLETEQSTIVRINDRGPFVAGRIIDLSRAAAAAIGMAGSGVARVRVEVVPPGQELPAVPQPRYTIQLGAFRTRSYADSMRRDALARGFPVELESGEDGIYRVVLPHVREQELAETRRRLAAAGWSGALARLEH
ncbi:MAG: septal ring lytic transglycosylase RlpA family protein [Spirochaetales bacterium]|nr:septal ring lytic transglycosylase RlpA family protein [Spirochaetales bacterium]